MLDKEGNKVDQSICYKINECKVNRIFDIPNDISENCTLVQLMGTVGNVNHAVNIVGHWIFDSN